MHERMRQQLAEKQARDEAEAAEKAAKVDLRNASVKPKIDAWAAGKKVSKHAWKASLHSEWAYVAALSRSTACSTDVAVLSCMRRRMPQSCTQHAAVKP